MCFCTVFMITMLLKRGKYQYMQTISISSIVGNGWDIEIVSHKIVY